MAKKSGDRPKVRITSKGAVYVDINELLKSPKVQDFIAKMAELEKKSQGSRILRID